MEYSIMIQPRNATTGVCCLATMSILLDKSLKDHGYQSKTPHNSDTRAHTRRNHFRKARGPTKGNNSILPFIVFIMLCSVVNGDPPTALTSGLLNTAATGDTTIAGSMYAWAYTSQSMTGLPQTVYVGMSGNNNVPDNIKIFKYDLSVACMATWRVGDLYALVIKGPGKVFAGSHATTDRLLYTITHAEGIYTMTLDSTVASDHTYYACGDDDSTNNYAFVTNDNPYNMINKIDIATGAESLYVMVGSPENCAAGPGFNYVVITGYSNIEIILKTDMSNVGTAMRSVTTGTTSFTTIDNLDTGMLYYFTSSSYELAKADLNTATSTDVTETMVWSVSNAYGDFDRPLNFGPYQYVVTLTVNTVYASVLVIDKTSNTPAVAASFDIDSGMQYYLAATAGPMFDYSTPPGNAYVTGIATEGTGSFNLQSYYLTVDRCVTRTALICTDCVAPYYRVGTSANNLCQTPAEFAASKFGIESNVTRLANSCSDINCIDCSYNKDICITCKRAWYLDTTLSQCRHPRIAPVIGNGYGGNVISGQIAACGVAHCQLCKADHTKCVGCDTGSGWYVKMGTDTCYHASNLPVFPIGKGPRISDGTVRLCSDSRCKICTANYQTCTECDATSNFELKGNKCELRPSSIKVVDKDLEKISSAMPLILGITTFIGRLVVTPFSYEAAFITQSLTSQLLILATLDGPEVKKSERVLRSVTHLARWFPTGNPFGTWGERVSCRLSPAMKRNQFTCSLVGNMGAHLVMLLIIGFICTLITVASMLVLVKTSPSSTKTRAVMSWLRSNFGISFMLSLGNALHFELLFYSLHTFAKSSNSSVLIFSDFIGAIVIVCLALSMAIQKYLAVWIWRQISETARVAQAQPQEQTSESSVKKSVQLIRDTVDLKAVPRGLGSFICMFSEYKMPTRFFQLLIGSSLSLKNLIQSIVILSASDKPALQVSLVLVTELAYMVLYLISRPIGNNLLLGVHILNHFSIAIFLILKLVSISTKISEDTRQGHLGITMAAFVYIAILATSFYTLIACLQAISQLTLWIRSRRSSQYAPEGLNTLPSSPIKKGFLTNEVDNRGPNMFQAPRDGESQKTEFKDSSNQEGRRGDSTESPDYFHPTKLADPTEVLESHRAGK